MTPAAATVSAGSVPAPARLDFPSWLPAMLVKELRQGLRTRGFVGSFMGFQTVMIIAFFYAAVLPGGAAFEAANSMFWSLFTALLLFVTPLRALAGLGSEIEGRSVDLLVLTQLNASRIVLGKWVSLMAQAALLAAALLPYGVLRYYLGSVDLVSDLGYVAGLMAGCALLSAVALWISGWPKGLRLLCGVALVPAFFLLEGSSGGILSTPYSMILRSLYGSSRYPYGGMAYASAYPTFGSTGWASAIFIGALIFDGLILVGFSLVQGARRLAPPAENHSSSTRVLALLTLVPPLVLTVLVSPEAGGLHLVYSAIGLLLVCGMEMSRVAEPMRVQVRPWLSTRASWRFLSGPLMLPGWPSAALFAVAALVLLYGIAALILSMLPATSTDLGLGLLLWWLVLAWVGLVFPILLLTFFGNYWRFSVPGYWIVQGLMAILGIISLGGQPGEHSPTYLWVLDAASQVLPVSSFWLGWQWMRPDAVWTSLTYTPIVMICQFIVLVGTIMLLRERSGLYWRMVWDHASVKTRDPGPPPA